MTAPVPTPRRAWQGGLALLLSILVHGLVVLACALAPARARHSGTGGLLVEQQVKDAGPEVGLFLAEVTFPATRPTPPAPSLRAFAPNRSEQDQPPPPAPAVIPQLDGNLPTPVGRTSAPGPRVAPESGLAQASFGGTATPAGPGGVSIAFFGIPAKGETVVYVLDRSASMGQGRSFADARRALLASLERLPTTIRFQVIVYNRTAEVLRIAGGAELVAATPENKREATHLLNVLHTEGSTEHLPALQRALGLQPDVIYFLTDAHDLKVEHARAITRLNRGRSVIHAIVLGNEKEDSSLRSLARENRGEYRAVRPFP